MIRVQSLEGDTEKEIVTQSELLYTRLELTVFCLKLNFAGRPGLAEPVTNQNLSASSPGVLEVAWDCAWEQR